MVRSWLAVDIETEPDEAALAWLAPLVANKTLRDQAKIDADLDSKARVQRDKMSLDPWASHTRVICYQTEADDTVQVLTCPDDAALGAAIDTVLEARRSPHGETRTFLGFRVRGFDLPHMAHHARRLGRTWPKLDLRRWGTFDCLDLYDLLCDDDCEHVVSRSLKQTCRIYGINVPDDDIDGAAVAERLAAGDWQAVIDHCVADVQRTVALAQRVRAIVDPTDISMATQTARWLESQRG